MAIQNQRGPRPASGLRAQRKGAIVVWAAFLLVIFLGMAAFSIDVGYMMLTRAELHRAADSAALAAAAEMLNSKDDAIAEAQEYAGYHRAAAEDISVASEDVEFGTWDSDARTFTPTAGVSNAIRVTAHRTDAPLFFAWAVGGKNFDAAASAIATVNPRDIVFVVDLSGSMNDDTEPAWATSVIDSEYGPQGFPTAGTDLMIDIFSDFGFGAFPGTLEYLAASTGVPQDEWAYAELTKNGGPLAGFGVPVQYRIEDTDDEATRKVKAYSWIIDNQIASVMPAATPVPDSTVNYTYWEKYLDYIILPAYVADPNPPPADDDDDDDDPEGDDDDDDDDDPPGPPPPPPPPTIGKSIPGALHGDWFTAFQSWQNRQTTATSLTGWEDAELALGPAAMSQRAMLSQLLLGAPGQPRLEYGWVPHWQDSDRITNFNNPNMYTFPDADSSLPANLRNYIGYVTYVQFMLDHGRDLEPYDIVTPISTDSPDCPYHPEVTAGGTFNFPPREQPMHAVRRSLIAAIQVVKDHNDQIADHNQRDWVSIVAFDRQDGTSPVLKQVLTGDYDVAMASCTTLQAVGDKGATTATESGMILAKSHITPASEGGAGRENVEKVVVVLTDGVPNVYQSLPEDVDDYIVGNPNADYHDNGAYWYDAPLMQTAQMKADDWQVYPVGIGLGTDYDFLDRMARVAGTEDADGQSPRGSGNPAEYESRLTEIFEDIITNVKVRLVK